MVSGIGVLFIIVGLLSIVYYKQGAELYAEQQKGWGLEDKRAIVVGRFIGLFGGFLLLITGVLMVFR